MGEIFNRALNIVEANKKKADEGITNVIPFGFQRLAPYLPGLQKSNYTIVTAGSGIGKSKFTKIFYVMNPYEYVRSHPEMGIKFSTLYFCLEESKESFIHSMMCYKLYKDHRLRIPVKQLKSYTTTLSNETIGLVRNMHAYFEEFEDSVHIIDNVRNPTGIYKECLNFLSKNGTWKYRTYVDDDGNTRQSRDIWVPSYPDHYVQGVVDHISLLHTEKDHPSLHESISKFSSEYAIDLRDRGTMAMTIVQQQSAAKEQQQYTNKGTSIESKLEPSLDGLGDNKLTQRDANEIIGLFAPDRFEIQKHRDYRIVTEDGLGLEDNYRSAVILKSRDGEANIRTGLFFDGASNVWEELPRADEMDDQLYELYLARAGRSRPVQGVFQFN